MLKVNKFIKICTAVLCVGYSFIFANLLTTCALAHEFRYEVVDDPIKPYVNEYLALLKQACPKFKYSKNYVIEISEELPKPEWVGLCTTKINGFHVQLLEKWWVATPNRVKRKELVYHELSHCFLRKEHEKSPSNYMHESLAGLDEDTFTSQAFIDMREYCGGR